MVASMMTGVFGRVRRTSVMVVPVVVMATRFDERIETY